MMVVVWERISTEGVGMSTITTIRKGNLEASIDSQGAQLMSVKRDGGEYLWQGDPKWWPRRAPVLFPIVGNIRNDEADSAQGKVRLGRHGIARNCDHAIAEATESSVTYELVSTPQTREKFPFDFKLNMTYALTDEVLIQRFQVTNTGDVTLPFTLGGHPAFNVPAPGDDADFSEYVLKFAEPWTFSTGTLVEGGLWDLANRMPLLQDSDTLHLTHQLFSVDTLMFENVPQRTVQLLGPAGHGVELDFDGFDYLGVWSAANDAPFVAVEPWRGPATCTDEDDTFENKRGIDLLEPGEVAEYQFTIRPF